MAHCNIAFSFKGRYVEKVLFSEIRKCPVRHQEKHIFLNCFPENFQSKMFPYNYSPQYLLMSPFSVVI